VNISDHHGSLVDKYFIGSGRKPVAMGPAIPLGPCHFVFRIWRTDCGKIAQSNIFVKLKHNPDIERTI
jgi:hypothetical protein